MRPASRKAPSCVGNHEHLGVADAARRVPHAHLSRRHDARAAARSADLHGTTASRRAASICRSVDRRRFRRARRRHTRPAAGTRQPSADLDLAALDTTRRAAAPSSACVARTRVVVLQLPALIIWGREDEVFDPSVFAPRFKQMLPHAEGPHLVTGRHFLQEDSGPEIFSARIVRFPAEADMIAATSHSLRSMTLGLPLCWPRIGWNTIPSSAHSCAPHIRSQSRRSGAAGLCAGAIRNRLRVDLHHVLASSSAIPGGNPCCRPGAPTDR